MKANCWIYVFTAISVTYSQHVWQKKPNCEGDMAKITFLDYIRLTSSGDTSKWKMTSGCLTNPQWATIPQFHSQSHASLFICSFKNNMMVMVLQQDFTEQGLTSFQLCPAFIYNLCYWVTKSKTGKIYADAGVISTTYTLLSCMVPGDYSKSIDSNPDPYIGTANIKQI